MGPYVKPLSRQTRSRKIVMLSLPVTDVDYSQRRSPVTSDCRHFSISPVDMPLIQC